MALRFLGSLALVIGLSVPHAFAQAYLVKDVRPQTSPAGSSAAPLVSVGNLTYFYATLPSTGYELWKTDGTAAGTQLVRDICAGTCSAFQQFNGFGVALGNRIVFVANDEVHGYEMWASDGTADGTVLLADVNPGSGSGQPATFIKVAGSLVYFDGVSPTAGREVWCTDGTPAGTHMVIDLDPGTGTSFPTALGSLGSRLVFRGFDGTNDGIFITDGTQEGTHRFSPVTPFRGITLGGNVLMSVHEADQSWSVWKTDGTTAGTVLVRGGFKGAPDQMTVAGNVLYFVGDDGVSGTEIWRTDGTAGGTSLLADQTPGSAGSTFRGLRDFGGKLLFAVGQGPVQMWISDGSTAGTRLLKELPDISLGASVGSTVGQRYLFPAKDVDHGWELWTTDGTPEGTQLVADIAPGPAAGLTNNIYVLGRQGGVFFPGDDGVHGIEPWVSDGTAAGTHMLNDLRRETALGSSPSSFVASGGRLLFSATDASGAGIWTSDGTATGTVLLSGMPGVAAASAVSAGVGYFDMSYPDYELWRSDGTSAGTFRLYSGDVNGVSDLVGMKNGLFFLASDAVHSYEPWISDGTVAGTHILADLQPGDSTSYPAKPARAGDYVYFSANYQPYRTDGTAGGTIQLTTTLVPSESSQPGAFTQVGGSVYFVAAASSDGFNLWRTDMATTQAVLVHHFTHPEAPSVMSSAGSGLMLFTAGALWRSDGTDAGTVKLIDGVWPLTCQESTDVIAGDGILYWYNFANPSSPELWRSDGTLPGTFKLASFAGTNSAYFQACFVRSMTYADHHLYFIGSDPVHGAEPWISDGTVAGTQMLADVNPGAGNSDPASFLKIGPTLYFAATEPGAGRELWAITEPDCPSCKLRRRAVGH